MSLFFFLLKGRLRIPNVTYSDAGRYTCVLGKRTQSVDLLVEYPEEVGLDQLRKNAFIQSNIAGNLPQSGDDLVLKCGITNSESNYKVTWEKYRNYLPSNAQISGEETLKIFTL